MRNCAELLSILRCERLQEFARLAKSTRAGGAYLSRCNQDAAVAGSGTAWADNSGRDIDSGKYRRGSTTGRRQGVCAVSSHRSKLRLRAGVPPDSRPRPGSNTRARSRIACARKHRGQTDAPRSFEQTRRTFARRGSLLCRVRQYESPRQSCCKRSAPRFGILDTNVTSDARHIRSRAAICTWEPRARSILGDGPSNDDCDVIRPPAIQSILNQLLAALLCRRHRP